MQDNTLIKDIDITLIEQQQTELHEKLKTIVEDLNGNIEIIEFKDYILSLIFYRYFSENVENKIENLLLENNITLNDLINDKDIENKIKDKITNEIGCFIHPKYFFTTLIKNIQSNNFNIEMLYEAFAYIEKSAINEKAEEQFSNLFDDIDLTSTKLGKNEKTRVDTISKMMLNINNIDIAYKDMYIDVLGDTYEYLMSQLAAKAGKKAGVFYTPQQVSKILSKIVTNGKTHIKSVYDPTCGSGSLLFRVAKETNVNEFYGQELNRTTANLARMNMLIHDVNYTNFDIKNDDTLEHPQHIGMKFDTIVANPPYSVSWSADPKFLDDERFSAYGKLAPKSKADFAFIQHMIHHLDDKGTMTVVLPHGVLFRGAGEGVIRKYLIEDRNVLDAVIGLPANIFFGTSIPTVILVFKKCRENNDILFIDASNEFEKGKNQNNLTDANVEKIVDTYVKREITPKYSYVASMDEIKENDYNLNIPRYVDTFEEEEPIDLDAVSDKIKSIDEEIAKIDEKLAVYLRELGL